ncbi:MAG: TlyA family RNA methyltransferase [Oscillospiraceae bacterium]|nr:TlyA family RNA methyltransferase [Oscillospiraceae bacterium]
MSKIRLDQLVFEQGYADSREKAKAIVMSGNVFINGQRADKPGMPVAQDASLEVHLKELPFVSRGGYKLDKALKVFPIVPSGKICIDCGASTGGFTDVLLQHDAAKIYAVDVGYGQLAWKIRNDARVVNLERTNLRYLTEEQIPELLDLAVCDVSFISLRLVMPAVAKRLKSGAQILCLIKPQFEAGKELVGKKGVIRSAEVHEQVIRDIVAFMPSIGFSVQGLDFSPVTGPEGNIEFLLYMVNAPMASPEIDITAVVSRAHMELK